MTLSTEQVNLDVLYPQTGYLSDDLSEILKVLYSAALAPEKWQIFLSLLCELGECRHGFMICADSQTGLSILSQGGDEFGSSQLGDLQFAAATSQCCSAGDWLRQPWTQSRRIGVFFGGELLPDEGLLRAAFYSKELVPKGLRCAALIVAAAIGCRVEAFSLWRAPDQGPLREESRQLFELLFPHIQSALEIRQELSVRKQRAASAETMSDASAAAALLVKQDGRLIHRNTVGARLLERGDALCVQNGLVSAASGRSRSALRSLLVKVGGLVGEAANGERQAMSLERTSGEEALHLIALPLSAFDRRRTGADILVMVSDPARPASCANDVLQSLYSLTRAQAEVANGLLEGRSLEEIATLRGVSTGTVRQQLKAIMAKTGTQRQGELISLLFKVPGCFSKD